MEPMEVDHGGKELADCFPPFFFRYKDGSVQRSSPGPPVSPSLNPPVFSKDIILHPLQNLWARLFMPSSLPPNSSLPVVLYFHGGGFIFGSPNWINFHVFCSNLVKLSNCICLSSSYRLAPEHPLPASFDDAFLALSWLHSQSLLQTQNSPQFEPWLASADFSKCFIAGESAGGAIVHQVALRAAQNVPNWNPFCIRGLIYIHPGFLREKRTQEEMDCAQDGLMNWAAADLCMKLVLPPDATKDHPFVNPIGPDSPDPKDLVLPRMLVALADNDGLHYMGLEFCKAMEAAGHSVEVVMSEGVGHVFFIAQPESQQAQTLMQALTNFITRED